MDYPEKMHRTELLPKASVPVVTSLFIDFDLLSRKKRYVVKSHKSASSVADEGNFLDRKTFQCLPFNRDHKSDPVL